LFQILDLWIVLLTSLAVFFDILFKKIPNWLILLGLLGGLLLNGLAGPSRLYASILGFVLGLALFFVPFVAGWLGAGDVKYFAVVGGLLGVNLLPRVLFYSVLTAGLLSISSVFYHKEGRGIVQIARNAWFSSRIAVLSWGRLLPAPRSAGAVNFKPIPWGVAIGVGTILAYYFDSHGAWLGF
jgi:Flp pilus assembly protein protease CpaA